MGIKIIYIYIHNIQNITKTQTRKQNIQNKKKQKTNN